MEVAYPVSEHYYTLQGEGAHTGTPMYFVRLQGCDVGCPWCDTKHSWERDKGIDLTASQIVAKVKKTEARWVCITGGEPMMHNLVPLVTALREAGLCVALETSGTEYDAAAVDMLDWVCVSPKENMPGGKRIYPSIIKRAHELKFVVGRVEDVQRIHDFLLYHGRDKEQPVFLQPVSGSEKATNLCIEACKENAAIGWRLSLQTHKLVNIP